MNIILLLIVFLVLAGIIVYALARRKTYSAEPREPRPDEKKGTTYLEPQAEEPTVQPESKERNASEGTGHTSP